MIFPCGVPFKEIFRGLFPVLVKQIFRRFCFCRFFVHLGPVLDHRGWFQILEFDWQFGLGRFSFQHSCLLLEDILTDNVSCLGLVLFNNRLLLGFLDSWWIRIQDGFLRDVTKSTSSVVSASTFGHSLKSRAVLAIWRFTDLNGEKVPISANYFNRLYTSRRTFHDCACFMLYISMIFCISRQQMEDHT